MEKNNRIFILIFLGMLTAFGPFVTDMYLPTLPSMAEYFGTSASMVQLGLSSGMAGLAIGQLIFGPISDRTGRKPPLVTALVLFLAATAGCIYAADIYTGRDLAAMLAVIGAINGIAPVTAPVIGGALAGGAGWHGIFWCLFGIGVMLLGGTAHFRETHRTKPSDSKSESRTKGASRKGRPIIGGFAALSGNRLYMCYILQFAFSQAVLFTNISSSPFIMQEHYGFSPMMFSICFGANALAIGAAAALSLKFRTMEQAFLTGSIGMAAVYVLLCAAMCLGCSFWLYEILLLCLLTMLGLTFTSSNTLAMDAGREHAGAASALLGAFGFAAGGLVSPLTGLGDIMVSSGMLFVAGSVLSSVCAIAALRYSGRLEYRRDTQDSCV
ncbi:MAG: MFS transporter [Bacteroidetes bacterium]|uniref:MFS transporter n=1 Tax=Candidatus Cryptobacteroides excrementipullorum TaxID=2840761 RepID=A0A9D9IUV3_9BACT|nr:MFS transporter [Candidatus Cryptobacteroides excrementipullorum]